MPPNHGKAGLGLPPGAQNLFLTGKTSRGTLGDPDALGASQLWRNAVITQWTPSAPGCVPSLLLHHNGNQPL